MFSKTRRGFTLIELLIVIVVIAILALIVIPRVMNASDRARKASYDANKQIIRNAVEQFRTDVGVYPSTLADLYATSLSTGSGTWKVSATTEGYTGFVGAGFHGPYLTVKDGSILNATDATAILLPANPYVDNTATANQTIAAHWTYTPSTGADYTLAKGSAGGPATE